jgi:hypothetical protein
MGYVLETNSASANTIIVPLNSSVNIETDSTLDIVQYGTGQTTITAEGGVIIYSRDNLASLYRQYSIATLYKRGTNEWILAGDLI